MFVREYWTRAYSADSSTLIRSACDAVSAQDVNTVINSFVVNPVIVKVILQRKLMSYKNTVMSHIK